MEFDFSELTGRIITVFGSRKRFAEAMEMTDSNLSMKLNNRTGWSTTEIYKSLDLLSIEPEKIGTYFFTPKVH